MSSFCDVNLELYVLGLEGNRESLIRWGRRSIAGLVVCAVLITNAMAQVGLPALETPSTVRAIHGYFVGGTLRHYKDRVLLPLDESKSLAEALSRQWLETYDAERVSELEMVPLASLLVSLKRDTEALSLYDRRLAMPTLTTLERAFTLGQLIHQFVWDADPERMAVAKRYVPQLVELPDSAAFVVYTAYKSLVSAHFARGERDSVLYYSRMALQLTPRIAFPDRKDAVFFQHPAELPMFAIFASAAGAEPDGQKQIKAMIEWLSSYAAAPTEIVAVDSMRANGYTRAFQFHLKRAELLVSRLGVPARPLIATHWLNHKVPAMPSEETSIGTQLRLDDGKVRMIVFGNRSCAGCQIAAAEMQRMQPRIPATVELIYAINTEGHWGIDLIEPDQEVEELRKHYVEDLGYTYPIAIWAGPKQLTHDGGMSPQRTPNSRYFTGTPTVMITNAQGIIRYYFQGYSPDITDYMIALLAALATEHAS